jgi:hypothetical protein
MSYIGNQPTTTAFLTDTFSANGSGTVFTLSAAPANTASIIVAVSGVLQDPTTYSVSGLTLTFSAAPPAGTGNISVRFLGIPASGVTTTAYRTVTEFTATAGQTTFTPPSYTVGYINVYRNGALLGTADYTATNGTTVVLASAASSGDLVVVESFYVSSVLNAIPATAGAVNSTYLLDGSVTSAKFANLTTLPTSGGNITLPSVTGTAMVSGNMPAFSAYQNSAQSLTANTSTKIVFQAEEFDTANCYASNTFTPNVAGYYQFSSAIQINTSATTIVLGFFKNGSLAKRVGNTASSNVNMISGSALIYCNGTTDYIEVYAQTGTNQSLDASADRLYFQGVLVRTA